MAVYLSCTNFKRIGCSTPRVPPIRVALLDSGVLRDHPFVGPIEAEVQVVRSANGRMAIEPTEGDNVGHGTACAAVIRAIAPGVRLYSVKIFEDELATTMDRLVQAIAWAAKARADVINLSLGIMRLDNLSPLEEICRWALDRASVLVAARERGGRIIYPGALPGVISVRADAGCRWGDYLCDEEHPWQVTASPYPVRLPGVPPEADFHGSSIATSHVSGLVSRLIQRTGARGAEEVVRNMLEVASSSIASSSSPMRRTLGDEAVRNTFAIRD